MHLSSSEGGASTTIRSIGRSASVSAVLKSIFMDADPCFVSDTCLDSVMECDKIEPRHSGVSLLRKGEEIALMHRADIELPAFEDSPDRDPFGTITGNLVGHVSAVGWIPRFRCEDWVYVGKEDSVMFAIAGSPSMAALSYGEPQGNAHPRCLSVPLGMAAGVREEIAMFSRIGGRRVEWESKLQNGIHLHGYYPSKAEDPPEIWSSPSRLVSAFGTRPDPLEIDRREAQACLRKIVGDVWRKKDKLSIPNVKVSAHDGFIHFECASVLGRSSRKIRCSQGPEFSVAMRPEHMVSALSSIASETAFIGASGSVMAISSESSYNGKDPSRSGLFNFIGMC